MCTSRPTAFDLWLTESRDNLQESQSDLSAEEFSRMAVDTFRALSKEDRQVRFFFCIFAFYMI